MSNLVIEILLRLIKPAVAALIGLGVYVTALLVGAPGSVELALLAWISAAAFILLVQDSPL